MTTYSAEANDAERPVGRRSVLLGAGGLVLGAGGAGVTAGRIDAGAAGQDEASTSDQVRDRSEAFVWDSGMEMAFTNTMQLAGDPAGEGRDSAVHVTSHGAETRDYVAAGIDLRPDSVTLSDVSDPGSITYDSYTGAAATDRVPDDVFLLCRTSAETVTVAFRGADADQPETWETRDVSTDLTADGWRTAELDAAQVDVDGERVGLAADDLGTTVDALVRAEPVEDLAAELGDDATVLGLAIGVGSLNGAVIDASFDDLQVLGDPRPIPALLSMDVSFTRPGGQGRTGGRLTASLSFAHEAQGLSVADIDPDSIRLAPYSPVAPPLPGTAEADAAVAADSVEVADDSVEAAFVPGQVQRLLSSNRPLTAVVSGGFDGPDPYTFVGVGELEGAGRGN